MTAPNAHARMDNNWVSKPEAVAIFQNLLVRGMFSLNEISIYSNILEFHYYGDEQQKAAKIAAGEMTYCEAIGADYCDYKKLRAKLRKVGLFIYNNKTKRWLLRNPEMVVGDPDSLFLNTSKEVKS